jgi:2'-5' RNA ligase
MGDAMSVRLFVGLALDPLLADALAGLPAGLPGARWVEADNLHLTLRFIGAVDEDRGYDLHHALSAIRAPAFELELAGFGTFGGRHPHSLWVGATPQPALDFLRDKVDSALVRAGLPPEPRRFSPHVTLARLGRDTPLYRVQDFIAHNSPFRAGPAPVDAFTLFRSHLSHAGADYEAVAAYPLGQDRPALHLRV